MTVNIMATGHREVRFTHAVSGACEQVLARYLPDVCAVAGGAAGADSLWADAAVAVGAELTVILPNRCYIHMYDVAPPPVSAQVRFAVDRPDVSDWKARWHPERWWRDNFARNDALIAASELAVVISSHHPAELAAMAKGGTVHAVKRLAAAGRDLIWVPDAETSTARWVRFNTGQQATLLV
jgi:hypothetical protein